MKTTLRFFSWSIVLSLLLWKFSSTFGLDLSQFPGTFTFQSGRYGLQIPLLFCVLVSGVLTLVATGIRRLSRS